MPSADLDAIRVTAERVQRFLTDLEKDATPANRERLSGAMSDLQGRIRQARAQGVNAVEIHQATEGIQGRFHRSAPAKADAAGPERLS